MGKKKQLQGAVVEIDMPVDVPPPPPPEQKKKREISDAQRANLAKGMAALKARREAKSKIVEAPEPEVQEKPVPIAPPVVVAPAPPAPVQEVKPRKPRVVKNYLTTDDFNSFRNELFTSLKRPESQNSVPHVPVRETPPVTIVQPIKERVITGRELLDKIFNF